MYSYNIVLTGPFGSGKTATAVSYTPPGMKPKQKIRRLVIDHELRAQIYLSPDGVDHPEKLQWAFETINENGRVTGSILQTLMVACRKNEWQNGKPDVIAVDDGAMLQDTLFHHWAAKENALAISKVYGKDTHRCLTATTWKPKDPGTISFFKELIVDWLVDLKVAGISFILTTPPRNVWANYGKSGNGPDGKPLMRIEGKSAKILDCWLQMADVVWSLDRTGKDGKLIPMPEVKMDMFVPKASMPGVAEQFIWPGWAKLWDWHEKRTFTADPSKLEKAEPTFDADQMEKTIKAAKSKLIMELKDIANVNEIAEILNTDFAPVFDFDTATKPEVYKELASYVKVQIFQKFPDRDPGKKATK